MKKFFANTLIAMLLVLPLGVAFPAAAVTIPHWDVSGNYVLAMNYQGADYAHDMTLLQDDSGNLTGNGGNPAGGPHTYTWVLTSGSVSGNTVDFLAHYTASADATTPLTVMHVTGTIASNGTMSGAWTDNYQGGSRAGTWTTTSGSAASLGSLAAEDFGVVNYDTGLGMLKGYTAGFGLTDATFEDVQSVVVQLFAGAALLQTNTATSKVGTDITGNQISSPFDVSGTFEYATDGYWTNVRESQYGQSVAATRVVATVTLVNGKVVIAENTILNGDPTTIFSSEHVAVNLLSAGDFAILSQTGITNTGSHTSVITGNIGASPITAASMNTVYCSEITEKIYGVDAAYVGNGDQTCFAGNPPLVANKTLVDQAVLDMGTAYSDAAGRTNPTATELGAGNIGGMTLASGLYKWSTGVMIPTSVTLSGDANDVWIFQIAGDLQVASAGSVASGVKVLMAGGAKAENVFWQVGGATGATLGTYATFNGNILTAKQVIIQTGAVLNGRALAQTQVTLDSNTVSVPASATAPASVQVHLLKYVDGVKATSANVGGVSFPMFTSTYNAPFTLSPSGWSGDDLAYEATTSPMPIGSSYAAEEKTNTSLVGTSCDGQHTYALTGYSVGETLAAAVTATPSLTAPSFTNLTTDKYVVVHNHLCAAPTFVKVHILKYLDGAEATAIAAAGYQFPMISSWNADNTGAGSGSYKLGAHVGGATALYGADTSAMQAPADYSTSEVTDTSSLVLPPDAACVAGKYRLEGYQTSAISFADAAAQAVSTVSPNFTDITTDQFVLVRNTTCPTTGSLTVVKDTIGGNGTFNFTSNIPGHAVFSLTTTNNTRYQTFENLTPGVYNVAESSLKGWTMLNNECASVMVAAGDDMTCVITNSDSKLLGQIRGRTLEDRNGNGALNNAWNHKLSGWTVYLDANNNGVLDNGERSTISDSRGNYRFTNLLAGTYIVRQVGQEGWIQTAPARGYHRVVLAKGKFSRNNDFGTFKLGEISGMKFNDLNGNRRRDVGEQGLQGWTINLTKVRSSTVVATAITDANGNYSFANLGPATYQVNEVQQSGWIQTTRDPKNIPIRSGFISEGNNFGNHYGSIPSGHGRNND